MLSIMNGLFLECAKLMNSFESRIGVDMQGSEYRINDRVVSWSKYNDALEKENILIKAKNFLVFQVIIF